jgi:hypothetical protein
MINNKFKFNLLVKNMNRQNLFVNVICIIIVLLHYSCKKDKDTIPDISIVDVSRETDWDYLIIGKEDHFYIKESTLNNSIPEVVSYYIEEADEYASILYSQNGYIEKVIFRNHIFLFSNFNGYKLDIGLIYPDGTIQMFRDLQTDYDWNKLELKSLTKISGKSDLIRWVGRTAGGVPCALSVAAAVSTSGALAPLAAWKCGTYLLRLTADIMENEFNIQNGFTEFGKLVGTSTLALNCGRLDWVSCASSSAYRASLDYADHLEHLNDAKDEVRVTTASLNYGYGDIQITLTWDNKADLDLHVIDPFGEEIYWEKKKSVSGGILDVDNINGYGPENVYWNKGSAPPGKYIIVVHHFDWKGYYTKPSTANYTILINAFDKIINKVYKGSINVGDHKTISSFDQYGLKSVEFLEFEISIKDFK